MGILTEAFNELMQKATTEGMTLVPCNLMNDNNNWRVEVSDCFMKDWEKAMKHSSEDMDEGLNKLKNEVLTLHNIKHLTPNVIEGKYQIRKYYCNSTDPSKSRQSGDRLFLCLYKEHRIIYFASFVPMSKHHGDKGPVQDRDAINNAKSEIKEKSDILNEQPIGNN
jgi:hypothetical protein